MSDTVSPAREAALYVLGRCRRFDAWSPQTLQAAFERFKLSERDSALCTRLCRGVLQNASFCDYYIGLYCSQGVKRLQPQVLDVLRLGACQLLFMDRIPVSAAVNEAVSLCRRTSPKAVGLVNAVLRRIAENRGALPEIPGEGTPEWLSTRYSHPLWLCEKLLREHGYDFTKAFLAANNEEAPLSVTMNPLRGAERLENVELVGSGAVQNREGFAEGRFFVQDGAAFTSAVKAGAKPGMRVLDGCAAPGGKSFVSAVLMENRGEIISCDLHEKKLTLIEEGAERLGIDIIKTLPMDGSKPYERLRESFDLVIADVPCSGLGVIRRKSEIRYKEEGELRRLPEIQLNILRGLSRCVKPGGVLHYSTCTILSEENDGVVEAFLKENPDFEREEEKTFWPHLEGTDGFYFCRMRRHA
ncbi:MAG: 16S rRNA (cytosine(967)-C(5))-methyltransferase RsmB [Ruminococcaceae bacterium]|nr:16S rRNA (cytosine(967)-C(5))-methyltransferase RsmB [Oscillospiraceae bacterium]